jgi:hypothetical protein
MDTKQSAANSERRAAGEQQVSSKMTKGGECGVRINIL